LSAANIHRGRRIYLDLGKVRDIAEVSVNGKPAGMTWAPPYRVDVTEALKPGVNRLEIKVTNEWTNRQLGDRLDPAHQILDEPPLAARGDGFGPPPSAPVESGLLGEVTLVAMSHP
jgi:hypothetical protein